MSTPKFTPILTTQSKENTLDFDTLKSMPELQKSVRQANVGVSDAYYHSAAFALGLSLAGTQISTSNGIYSNANLSAALDLAKLLSQLSTGITPGNLPLTANGSFGTGHSSSYTETFTSPKVPELPKSSLSADDALKAIVSLLSPSSPTPTFTFDALTEVKLMAALHNAMVNTEAFYNFDDIVGMVANRQVTGTGPGIWAPYRMQFLVSVTPGWYTTLNPCDAVLDLHMEDQGLQVLYVAPDESSQAVNEFTSSVDQMALALQLQGAFQAVAVNAAFNSLAASARRLEGLRQNTLHIVSYPDKDTIRLRMRPAVVPNRLNSELQPTSMLFTAVVLARQDIQVNPPPTSTPDKCGSPDGDHARPADTSTRNAVPPPSAPDTGGQPKAPTPPAGPDRNSGNEQPLPGISFKRCVNLGYNAFFEPVMALRDTEVVSGVARACYEAPSQRDRSKHYYVTTLKDGKPENVALMPLLPQYKLPPEKEKPFEFSSQAYGFVDFDAKGNAAVYISFAISNPPLDHGTVQPVTLKVLPYGYSRDYSGSSALGGVIQMEVPGLRAGAKNLDALQERVILWAHRQGAEGQDQDITQELVLVCRKRPVETAASKPPSITINKNGVQGTMPPEAVSPSITALVSPNAKVLLKETK